MAPLSARWAGDGVVLLEVLHNQRRQVACQSRHILHGWCWYCLQLLLLLMGSPEGSKSKEPVPVALVGWVTASDGSYLSEQSTAPA